MNNIIDDIRTVVEAIPAIAAIQVAYPKGDGTPEYMAGHLLEVNNRLLEKSNSVSKKYLKYPMITLRLDVPEEVDGDVINYLLNILIVTQTSKKLNAEERQEQVFTPILQPLYEAFITALHESGLFMWPGDPTFPPHTKVDRPYWGFQQAEGNIANKHDDPLDAIEIMNLKINKIVC